MPIIDYPFLRNSPDQPRRPMLRIRISNPATSQSLWATALIDTGADECALPAVMAKHLGYDLPSGTRKELRTGNGLAVAYSHCCKIEILDSRMLRAGRITVACALPDIAIDFMPNLHLPLLGVGNFLNRFILKINYPKKTFSIRKP